MANIAIIDDHPVARLAIRMLLEKDEHSIVLEADDGLQGLNLIRTRQPDMVIVDLDIPTMSGVEVIEKLRAAGFSGGILVLTGRDDAHFLSRCQQIGADGFVSKRNNLEELGDAVKAILRGYSYFPRKRSDGSALKTDDQETTALTQLSSRELQVLRYLAQGLRLVDISRQMHISNKTVSTYRNRIMEKLDISDLPALLNFARRHHLD